MPVIIAFLMRALSWLVMTYAGQWILKILVTLGLTVAVAKLALPALMSMVLSHMSALPPIASQAIGATGLDVFISMVLSAYVTAKTGKMAFRRAATS